MNKEVRVLLNEFVFVTLYAWTVILLFFAAESLFLWQRTFLIPENTISQPAIFLFFLWIFFAILPLLNTGIVGNPGFVVHAVFTGEAKIEQAFAIGVVDLLAYFFALFILPTSYTFPSFPLPAISPMISPLQGVLVEAAVTFGLVFSCAYIQRFVKISPSLTAATVIVTLIYIGSPFTGAWMNPSSATPTSALHGDYSHLWVYWVGPLLGSVISGLLFNFLFPQTSTPSSSSLNEKQKRNFQSTSTASPSSIPIASAQIAEQPASGTILQPTAPAVKARERRERKKDPQNHAHSQRNAEEQRQRMRQRQEEEEEKEKRSREEKKAAKKKLKALKESTRKSHSQITKSAAPAAPRRIAPVMQPSRRG